MGCNQIIFFTVFIAIILIIFIYINGKSWFGAREKSVKIIGKTIQFCAIECAPNGLLPKTKELPVGKVVEYVNSKYYLNFLKPMELNGKIETSANIQARHVGHPISSVNKLSSVTVTGNFESGEAFVAEIKLES